MKNRPVKIEKKENFDLNFFLIVKFVESKL